jgi:hypothetical protein
MQARCESSFLGETMQASIDFLNPSSGAHKSNGMIQVSDIDLRVAGTTRYVQIRRLWS